jgi:hypothetical protein
VLSGFVVTFLLTRTITRMIRDGRDPFRNQVTASGTYDRQDAALIKAGPASLRPGEPVRGSWC